MRAAIEAARGVLVLGTYMAGFVPVGYRATRAQRRAGRAAGMAIVRAHVDRVLRLGGVQWSVSGEEHLPEGGYVLVHNETSLADLCIVHGVVLHDFAERTIGAAEWSVVPGARWMFEALGITPFLRGDRAAADRVLDDLTAHAAAGGRVSMSGPGRVSRDDRIQRFKRGGALIAIRAGRPAVPVALSGGWDVMQGGSMRLRPGHIALQFGSPIATEGMDEEDAPALAARLQAEVSEMYEAARAAAGRRGPGSSG